MKNDDDFIHLPELYLKLGTLKKHLNNIYNLNINPMENSTKNINFKALEKSLNVGGYDDERMAMISCDIILEYAVKLDKIVMEDTELEEWVKSKISKTEQMMASIKHGLIGIEKYDHGGEMFKKQLLHIAKYAKAIMEELEKGVELMSWMESNLAVCADYMDGVYHQLDYKMGNRAKDVAADGIMMKDGVSDKMIVDFITVLEKDGIMAPGSHKNKTAVDTLQSIVNMPKSEFSKYIKKNPSPKINMIYREFQDWKQTYKNGGGVSETPIAMMREVTGKEVGSVPVSETIYSSQVNDFVNYVYEVYQEEGYTKAQVKMAVNKYINELGQEFTYGGGDSLDRERVYQFLLNPSLKGIKNPMMRDGGVSRKRHLYAIMMGKYSQMDNPQYVEVSGRDMDEAMSKFKQMGVDAVPEYISFSNKPPYYYKNGGGVDYTDYKQVSNELNILRSEYNKAKSVGDSEKMQMIEGQMMELNNDLLYMETSGIEKSMGSERMVNGGGVGHMNTAKSYWNMFDKNKRVDFLIGAGYSKSVAEDLSNESWDSLDAGVHKDLLSSMMADGGGLDMAAQGMFLDGEFEEVVRKIKDYIIKYPYVWTKGNKSYVPIEGWQYAASLMGLSAKVTEVYAVPEKNGWMAKAEVVNQTGVIVCSGFGFVGRDEEKWAKSTESDLESFSQTKAVSRALRNCISYLIKAAGYSTTPAEEMYGLKGSSKSMNSKKPNLRPIYGVPDIDGQVGHYDMPVQKPIEKASTEERSNLSILLQKVWAESKGRGMVIVSPEFMDKIEGTLFDADATDLVFEVLLTDAYDWMIKNNIVLRSKIFMKEIAKVVNNLGN